MESIAFGYCHGPDVSHAFTFSKDKCIAEGLFANILSVGAGAMSLDRGRNELAQRFLDETPHPWLLMVDTDMKWEPSDVKTLWASANPIARPVVGGLCFKIEGHNPDFGTIATPVMYRVDAEGTGFPVHAMDGKWQGMEKVDATGGAFLLIHRTALEKIGGDWFSYHPDQKTISEDWAFCLRLRDHGIPLHVNTRTNIGHMKTVNVDRAHYLTYWKAMQATFGAQEPVGADHV